MSLRRGGLDGLTLDSMGYFSGGSAGAAYVGPGDVIAGAYGWWGLRAYTSAAIGGNCVRLVRASDSTQQTFVTVAGGGVDVASIITFLAATTGKVVTLFDQSGNGIDLTMGTDANRPAFTLSGIGSLPVMTFAGGTQGLVSNATIAAQAQPVSASAYVKRTGAFTTQGDILQARQGSLQCLFANATNTISMYAGTSVPTATASDSHWHGLAYIFNGASSDMFVDGTTNAPLGSNPGTAGFVSGSGASAQFYMGDDGGAGGNPLTATITEGGWWPSDISANAAALRTNQQNYWGGS